jgi:galactose oxidase-like protein/starch binding protein with CBM20 domain/Kelch motif protein
MRIWMAVVVVSTSCTSIDGDLDDGKQDLPERGGRWSKAIDFEIVAAHAHLLPTGDVLYWDRGNTGGGVMKTTPWGPPRIWNPASGAITQVPKLDYEPFCSGHSFLPDGRLFVAGGHDNNDAVGVDRASIFDATTRTWSTVPGRMAAGRWYPSTAVLTNGDVLVLSGSSFVNDNGLAGSDLPQIYNTARGEWRDLPAARFGAAGGIDPRLVWFYPFTHLAPDGRVFMAGPARETGFLDTAGDGQWSMAQGAARPFSARSSEEFRDYGSTVMYDAGKIMIVGGSPSPGAAGDVAPVASADIIDLNAANPTWQAAAPMRNARRMHTATVLPDGNVLVTGGTSAPGFNDASGAVLEPELWDPSTNRWTQLAPMSTRRIYHSIALLLPDARVLVAGGGLPFGTGSVPDTDHPDAQIYEPPYLFKGPRPEVTNAPGEITHGSTFTVETPDAARIAKVTLIRLGSVTHAYNHNQRALALEFTRGKSTLDITLPANRNLAPAGHYMLFLVDDRGVPSVAPIVHVTTDMCDVDVTVRGVDFTRIGENVAITGDLPEIGQWNGRFGTVLSGAAFPTWRGTIRVPRGESFDWKAITVDSATGAARFEAGANRTIRPLDAQSCPAPIDVTWR